MGRGKLYEYDDGIPLEFGQIRDAGPPLSVPSSRFLL
jgi:hypothetical protein